MSVRRLLATGIALALGISLTGFAIWDPPRVSAADDPLGFEHYIGALHEHSGYSDGWPGSRPEDYFASAKGFGLDFLGSGEHSDNSELPITLSEYCLPTEGPAAPAECAVSDKEQPENNIRKWEATLEQARAATNESFTGFRGFEWSSDRFGHINVYFSRNTLNAYRDGGFVALQTFWNWFATPPSMQGGADGLATFNHPGDKNLSTSDPAYNWEQFAYVPAADARMVGLEVFNGTRDYVERGFFTQALDNGWHVGAIGAEDKGHEKDDRWGGPEWSKTVLIARDRSEAALREAMLARRFYAVLDNSIRIDMTAGGRPMGARIGAPLGTTVPIEASVPGATRLELVSDGGTEIAEAQGASLRFDAPVTDEEDYYFLRVIGDSGTPVAYSSPVWISPGDAAQPPGEWVAGDFHVHTCYSHDVYCGPEDDNTGPEEFYTFGSTVQMQFCFAAARGLDFLLITDHNDIRSQSDPGFGACGVMPVAGYENSLKGHAQMLGARRIYPNGDDDNAADINALVEALHHDHGAFQINHPAEGSVDFPHDADWGYGYEVVPDSVEVWNISRLWQPPAPSASSNDDAVRYWEGWLDRGHRIAATGGSDNHFVSTQAVQGVGQPTTWVYVTERSERGVVEAIRAGRTFITHQPPTVSGPRIYLEGDASGDGFYEALVGDEVPPGSPLRVRVEGAPGTMLRVLTDGGELAFEPVPVTDASFEHRFTLPADVTWARAEIFDPDLQEERKAACDERFGSETTYCRNQLLVLAMTSAIYLDDPSAEREASLLTYTGSKQARGETVDLAAGLTSVDGEPLADRVVSFEMAGDLAEARTDATGLAQTTMTLTDHGRQQTVTARFAGDDDYEPSQTSATIHWGNDKSATKADPRWMP